MHRVKIDSVREGARLGRTIFSANGGVLLTAGVELKEYHLERLKKHGSSNLYLDEEISEGIEVNDVIKDETRNEAVVLIKNMMNNYHFSSSVDVAKVKKMVNKILDELLENEDILYSLSEIKHVDDYTFEHSVNVCILSLITGIGLGFDINNLRDLGTGAILHDIGKLCIPREILKKPSQLTVEEFEEIKKHTYLGYEILKKSGNISLAASYIAFGHHERYDGSGYPLQLKKENIQLYSRIVAIADVYDALTSDRVYRKRLKPHEVYDYITSLGVHHFDPRVVESFVRYVTVYPAGTGVLLNTRERAVVVRNNRNFPTRPVVRIIYDERMKKKAIFKEIDLSKESSIFIIDTCEL
jgi:HD-GYP domain-containing protein (c-di-GMP phosphodiesterase class II)